MVLGWLVGSMVFWGRWVLGRLVERLALAIVVFWDRWDLDLQAA
jgi:hypothetical protein